MKPRKLLIKLGGTLLDAPESRLRLAREIAAAAAEANNRIAVVHGGGKQMTRFLAERGVESRFVNGLRVTTPEIIDASMNVARTHATKATEALAGATELDAEVCERLRTLVDGLVTRSS